MSIAPWKNVLVNNFIGKHNFNLVWILDHDIGQVKSFEPFDTSIKIIDVVGYNVEFQSEELSRTF